MSIRGLLTTNSVYQEYLAKSLTDKFGRLNAQMDKIIHDANSEIDMLNQQISSQSGCSNVKILKF